ncbi:MAG: globin [Actinomycetota bacterium]|nr:MAG: globin [Actinomycetota bacterium]
MRDAAGTPYARFGGEAFFRRLVDAFYDGVADDPVLRPLYPEADLRPAAERLTLFLMQYWGGPTTYSMQRGHPRLRLRHVPFVIDDVARDHWLRHMRTALDRVGGLDEADEAELWGYLTTAAHAMVNSSGPAGEPIGPESGPPGPLPITLEPPQQRASGGPTPGDIG